MELAQQSMQWEASVKLLTWKVQGAQTLGMTAQNNIVKASLSK